MQFFVQLVSTPLRDMLRETLLAVRQPATAENVAKEVAEETSRESRTWLYSLQQFQATLRNALRDKLLERLHSVTAPLKPTEAAKYQITAFVD